MASETKDAVPEGQPQAKPDEEKLKMSVIAARKVVEAQEAAASLKERAKKAVNPKERLKLLQEAYDKEIEAVGQSKYAKRLQSGAWQGAAAGGGIGGGVALGLGTVVGTLVSGLVSVPTVLLGGLVGAGVGSVHGPFLKFGNKEGKKAAMTDEEARAEAMKEAERLDQAVEKGSTTIPQRPQLDEPESEEQEETNPQVSPLEGESPSARKRPRKLNTNSSKETVPLTERRKPRKLEVRSGIERPASG